MKDLGQVVRHKPLADQEDMLSAHGEMRCRRPVDGQRGHDAGQANDTGPCVWAAVGDKLQKVGRPGCQKLDSRHQTITNEPDI